jgi:hypothetical protein
MSTLHCNTVETSSGGAVTLTKQSASKSWIKYNGTGTIAISGSAGVSSITDETTGTTTISVTNSFSDANYSIKGQNSDGALHIQVVDTNQTAVAYRQRTLDGGGSLVDDNAVYGNAHGDLA